MYKANTKHYTFQFSIFNFQFNMSNNYFCFKQFAIVQDNASMKVGTDGVLLGAWCNCIGAQRILDIGTGTGLLAIMAAQRSNAKITAVEIDANACIDAITNFDNSPWANRLELLNLPIQEFAEDSPEHFDCIICNPPFFSNSLKTPSDGRNLARHDDSLTPTDLFDCTAKLLTNNGLISIIIPIERLDEYKFEAQKHQLFITRKTTIQPTENLPPHRIMAEFSYTNSKTIEENLIIEQGGRHNYSTEYINLTKDFYLKF